MTEKLDKTKEQDADQLRKEQRENYLKRLYGEWPPQFDKFILISDGRRIGCPKAVVRHGHGGPR